MAIESIFAAAEGGLSYERLRMDAASRNIAAANVPVKPGEPATRWEVELTAAGLEGRYDSQQQPAGVRAVHDPSHPLADADGIVHYPDTDMVREMTTLMTASRGYEANVRSFNLMRSMVLRSLEIGAK